MFTKIKTASAGGGGSGNVTDINSDTTASQTLTVGSSGTAPNWVDNGSGDHKLNIPLASTSSVTAGLLSKTDYDNFIAAGGKRVRSTRFVSIGSGTSGTVTLPTSSTVVLDDFGGTVDAIVTGISGGRPTFSSVVTSAGAVVATSFDASGNYVFTGTPSAFPVALIYRVYQALKDFDSSTADIIGSPAYILEGPISSTDNAVARYNGTDGHAVQDSGVTIDDSGNLTATNVSGTNTGDQTITLTGNVTGSGTGSFATTLAATVGNLASATALVSAAALATVGTIASGTWSATTIAVNKGGTGQTSYTDGQLLIGNTSGNTLSKATLTAGTGITITNGNGTITLATNATTPRLTKTANYTILSTDATILVDTSGGAFNLTLPDPSTLDGKMYRIIDSTGNLSTNNLTLVRFGSEKISGIAASRIFQTDWGGWTITTNATDWFVF